MEMEITAEQRAMLHEFFETQTVIHKLITGQKNKYRIKVGTSVSDLASQRNTSVRTFIPLKLMIPSLIDSQGKAAATASCQDVDKTPLPSLKRRGKKKQFKEPWH